LHRNRTNVLVKKPVVTEPGTYQIVMEQVVALRRGLTITGTASVSPPTRFAKT